jgi:hypothetical protein
MTLNMTRLGDSYATCSCVDTPIRLALTVIVFLAVTCLVPTTNHAQSATNPRPMTNRDVIDLVTEGFSSDVIIAKIASSSSCEFDTTVEALKSLKRANVPQVVILAVVKAHAPAVGSTSSSKLRTIECPTGDTQVILWVAPGKLEEVSRLRCNERVTILVESPPWVLARTEAGLTGYLSASYFNGQNASPDPSIGAIPSVANKPTEKRVETKNLRPAIPAAGGQSEQLQPCSGKHNYWRF